MILTNFVKTYSELGCHRTGCKTQVITEELLSEFLERNSDKLYKFNYPYQHFQAESKVDIEGRLIPSLPLYYESIDKLLGSTNILSGSIAITENENLAYREIKKISGRAKVNDYDAVVIATCGETNSLYAFNVTPVLKNDIPVVLVSGGCITNL